MCFFPKFYKSSVVKETCLKITSLAQLILCTPVYFNFFKTGMTCRVVFKSPSAAAAAAAAAVAAAAAAAAAADAAAAAAAALGY